MHELIALASSQSLCVWVDWEEITSELDWGVSSSCGHAKQSNIWCLHCWRLNWSEKSWRILHGESHHDLLSLTTPQIRVFTNTNKLGSGFRFNLSNSIYILTRFEAQNRQIHWPFQPTTAHSNHNMLTWELRDHGEWSSILQDIDLQLFCLALPLSSTALRTKAGKFSSGAISLAQFHWFRETTGIVMDFRPETSAKPRKYAIPIAQSAQKPEKKLHTLPCFQFFPSIWLVFISSIGHSVMLVFSSCCALCTFFVI